jgi:hypothetical protein
MIINNDIEYDHIKLELETTLLLQYLKAHTLFEGGVYEVK